MDRRHVFVTLCMAGLASHVWIAAAYDNPRRVAPPDNEERRRIRRRVVARVIDGVPMWVVPTNLAVGWELVNQDRIFVVREIGLPGRAGSPSEVIRIDGDAGPEEIQITREDTAGNSQELLGSLIAPGDSTTPARTGT
jgi:hypothetical protein